MAVHYEQRLLKRKTLMPQMLLHDIIGPIMVGPSSSHTAGALAISAMARTLVGSQPKRVTFKLYGSFAHTYSGHGTDRALVAGMLGLSTDDLRIRDSFALAKEAGMQVEIMPLPNAEYDHPNTVDIEAVDEAGKTYSFRGVSVGGGAAKLTQIDGMQVEITGKSNSLVVHQHDEKGILAFITTTLLTADVNIATANLYRTSKGGQAFTIIETDEPIPETLTSILEAHPGIHSAKAIAAVEAGGKKTLANISSKQQEQALDLFEQYDFKSGEELLLCCEKHHAAISEVYLQRNKCLLESEGVADSTTEYLQRVLVAMQESAHEPLDNPRSSIGGLLGGEAQKVRDAAVAGVGLTVSPFMEKVVSYALAVLETNASMGRIVAAPTAGSAGVIPAVLVALQEERGFTDTEIVSALANAAAVGHLVARNATVAGAEGGCQAEIGTASAMAASAVVELTGGTPQQCLAAASNALTALMGLVCDPVGGLVEIPCQKRNATAAVNALISAQIALAGITNLVNFDQTVEAMFQVGRSLPFELRESGLGGIAGTPSACEYCESVLCRGKK